jgi:8-hydroxy-5-deazaflavin:NADPH oxidoreductase
MSPTATNEVVHIRFAQIIGANLPKEHDYGSCNKKRVLVPLTSPERSPGHFFVPNARRRKTEKPVTFKMLTRRDALIASFVMSVATALAIPSRASERKFKIGIIGAGNIGGELGEFLAIAGYPVMLSARDLDPVKALVARIGHGARVGTPQEAATFGEVVIVAVPWNALPQVGRDYGALLKGKVVVDTCNPRLPRDGDLAKEGLEKGTGVTDPQFLPGTRLVRAFNALNYKVLAESAHHAGEFIAIPIASDDPQAIAAAKQLVTDCGFEPVLVGGLVTAKSFDQGTPDYSTALTAAQLRKKLGPR